MKEKKFSITYYRAAYQRNIARVNSKQGRYMKGIRQSRVEPVFGTLTQFTGMGKVNMIGLSQANKVMHMAAMAYNLKKYLKFIHKTSKSMAKVEQAASLLKKVFYDLISSFLKPLNLTNRTLVIRGK